MLISFVVSNRRLLYPLVGCCTLSSAVVPSRRLLYPLVFYNPYLVKKTHMDYDNLVAHDDAFFVLANQFLITKLLAVEIHVL